MLGVVGEPGHHARGVSNPRGHGLTVLQHMNSYAKHDTHEEGGQHHPSSASVGTV